MHKWNDSTWVGVPGFSHVFTLFSDAPRIHVSRGGTIVVNYEEKMVLFEGGQTKEIKRPLTTGGIFLTASFLRSSNNGNMSSNIHGIDDVNLSRQCSQCIGTGKIESRYENTYVQGDWVEGISTSTSNSNYERIWNAACHCYEGVKTTSSSTSQVRRQRLPGKMVKKYIPGGTCTTCNGKGIIESMGKMWLEYDPVHSTYNKVTLEKR